MAIALTEADSRYDLSSQRGAQIKLSDREYQSLIFMACGKSVAEFGQSFSIKEKSAGNYRTHLFDKLGVNDSFQAVTRAVELRVFDPRGITRKNFNWDVFRNLSSDELAPLDVWLDSQGDFELTNKLVAAVIGRSERTLGSRLLWIQEKTGIHKREELFVHYYVYRNGLFDSPEVR